MKLLKFLLLISLMFACVHTYAQDVIVTKDKRHIQAEIIEVSPSVIKYRVYGKPNSVVISIPVKEVESVVYESDMEKDENEEEPEDSGSLRPQTSNRPFLTNTHLHAYIMTHGMVGLNSGFLGAGTKMSIGAQFSDYVYLGGGLGATHFNNRQVGEGNTPVLVPPEEENEDNPEEPVEQMVQYYDMIPKYGFTAFVTTKVAFPITRNVVPYIDSEVGFDISQHDWTEKWSGGWHYAVGAGISIYRFTLSFGYQTVMLPVDRKLKPYEEWTYYSEGYELKTLNEGCFYFKIGVKLGTLTDK